MDKTGVNPDKIILIKRRYRSSNNINKNSDTISGNIIGGGKEKEKKEKKTT